jgi:hypothetical protein
LDLARTTDDPETQELAMGVTQRPPRGATLRKMGWSLWLATIALGGPLALGAAMPPASAASPWHAGCWGSRCKLWQQVVRHHNDEIHTYVVGFASDGAGGYAVFAGHPLLRSTEKTQEDVALLLDGLRQFSKGEEREPETRARMLTDAQGGLVEVPLEFLLDVIEAKQMTIVFRDQKLAIDVSDAALPIWTTIREMTQRRLHPPADPRPTIIRW